MNQLTCPTCDRHGHVIVPNETPIGKKDDRCSSGDLKWKPAGSNPENCRETGIAAGCEIPNQTNPGSYRRDPRQSGEPGAGFSLGSKLGRPGYVLPLLCDTKQFQLS